MKKRGAKPKGKIRIEWSPDFAYAIGLFVADGCVSGNGRHISFSSKDIEQIRNFLKALSLDSHVGMVLNGAKNSVTYRVQIGDVLFVDFLRSIGVTSAKSRTVGPLLIPQSLFRDFLRGLFDGDGSSYSYFDKRWKSSFMFYVSFASASADFVSWLRETVFFHIGALGHVTSDGRSDPCYQLKYAKGDAQKVVSFMYYKDGILCLSRKDLKIRQSLYTIAQTSCPEVLNPQMDKKAT